MGIPCVNSRCSTEPSVDGSGRLNIDVRLDPNGALKCTDGLGLGVLLDPSAENIVSEGTAGLLASRTLHQMVSGLGNFPTGDSWVDGTNSASTVTTVTNPSATKDILAIVHIKWQFNFHTLAKEWEIDGTFNSNMSIGSNVSESFAIGGAGVSALSDEKVHAAHATVYRTIPASGSLVITSFGSGKKHSTADGSGGAGGSIGGGTFLVSHDILVVDSHAATTLMTVV